MASLGLKIACAVTMVNALISLCDGAGASGYCPMRTCGSNEIRHPFILQDDAIGGRCYTDYPDLEFYCLNKVLYLNFTANITIRTDSYTVTKIDYWNQTLSLLPFAVSATCRAFSADRFGGLSITNATTLALACPANINNSCSIMSTSIDVCNGTFGNVTTDIPPSWACPAVLKNFGDDSFSSCHLMAAPYNTSENATVELQFEGNTTLSFQNVTVNSIPTPSPSPGPTLYPVDNQKPKNKNTISIILGATSGSILMIIILCALCWCKYTKTNMKTRQFTQLHMEKMQSYKNQLTTFFTLKELQKATKNFSNDFKLGSGGFGTVYKGILDNGIEVAIKKTNNVDMEDLEQYMNEVSLLSQVNHRNLVKLLGCCVEVEVPMLVYEYVSNGDLYQHLHIPQVGMQLNWAKRLQIAIDTSEALRYLHSAAYPPIYHRDVKTSNILLDDKFNVKVADFGISRLVKVDATHVSTNVKGTPGYLDPEYFHKFQLTDKSDVYSFGMVLLELITSSKPIDFERDTDNINLGTMAMPFIEMKNVEAIVDSKLLGGSRSDSNKILVEIQKTAELASKCLADHGRDRPSMKEVVDELIAIQSINRGKNLFESKSKCLADHGRDRPSMKEVVDELIAIQSINRGKNLFESKSSRRKEVDSVGI